MRTRLALCALLLGCNASYKESPTPEQPRSPNASVMPTPLAEKSEQLPRPEPSASSSSVKRPAPEEAIAAVPRAVPNPIPLSGLHPPQADAPSVKVKEAQLLTLRALWSWPNVETQALEPEADVAVIDASNKQLVPQITIDLYPAGSMRWQWQSVVFPLRAGSELRARVANYGHILVWPDEPKYRNLPPGSLRATLAERRADATPLVLGTLRHLPNGKRLDHATETSELSTSYGTLLLEQAELDDAGIAGQLMCRTLVELIDASPTSPACTEDRLPLRAEFRFADGGVCVFSVVEITRKTDSIGRFSIPPSGFTFHTSGLPEGPSLLIESATLSKLHSRDRTEADNLAPHKAALQLDLDNSSPNVAYLVLDRVRLAMLEPYRSAHLRDLRPGRYHASWHSFFGGVLRAQETLDVPGRTGVGTRARPDAGTAP